MSLKNEDFIFNAILNKEITDNMIINSFLDGITSKIEFGLYDNCAIEYLESIIVNINKLCEINGLLKSNNFQISYIYSQIIGVVNLVYPDLYIDFLCKINPFPYIEKHIKNISLTESFYGLILIYVKNDLIGADFFTKNILYFKNNIYFDDFINRVKENSPNQTIINLCEKLQLLQ